MARDRDHLAGGFEADSGGGLLSGLLADEDDFDRRAWWRLGSWGFAAVGAVTVAVMANQSSLGWRRDQLAAADLARHTQQIQTLAKDSQNEARRLASAIDTLNGDRDRLYARVTTIEQGLDSVTGAISRQGNPMPLPAPSGPPIAAPPVAPVGTTAAQPAAVPDKHSAADRPPTPPDKASEKPLVSVEKPRAAAVPDQPPPVITAARDIAQPPAQPAPDKEESAKAAQSTAAAPPLVATQSIMAPPDPAAQKLIEPAKPSSAVIAKPIPEVVAATSPIEDPDAAPADAASSPVQRTEFGIDVGGANSVPGLRALWRGLLKSHSNTSLVSLRPIIMVREATNGLGTQLRLVAGPLNDAGAAARLCAVLVERTNRHCETTVFDGQRLAMKDDPPTSTLAPLKRRRSVPKRTAPAAEEQPAAKKPEASTLSSIFGRHTQ